MSVIIISKKPRLKKTENKKIVNKLRMFVKVCSEVTFKTKYFNNWNTLFKK